MKSKFFKMLAVAVLGAGMTTLPLPVSGIETGTGTNQTANPYATNSISLQGVVITNWQELTNSLDTFYIKNASNWSYYVAASNVNLSDKELTNVAAMTLGGERRTTWPSGGGELTNWSYYAAVSNVNLSNKELTNVAAMTLGDERRTNWPGQTITILADGAALQWTDQPAALTEFPMRGTNTMIDLSGYTQARLTVVVVVSGQPGSDLKVQYSTDQATWNYLDGSSGPSTLQSAAGLQVSSWVNIETVAQQDVYLRLVGSGGNGKKDPSFGLITLQIK